MLLFSVTNSKFVHALKVVLKANLCSTLFHLINEIFNYKKKKNLCSTHHVIKIKKPSDEYLGSTVINPASEKKSTTSRRKFEMPKPVFYASMISSMTSNIYYTIQMKKKKKKSSR